MTGPRTAGLGLGPVATTVRPGAVDALRLLPPEHRQVLLDTYVRRRGVVEAAQASGVAPLVVAVRVHASLSALATVAGVGEPPVPGSHPEVGAFALDLLDELAARAVADHVGVCAACGRELARLAPAADLLATVDGYAVPLDHAARPARAIVPRTAPTPVTGLTRPVDPSPPGRAGGAPVADPASAFRGPAAAGVPAAGVPRDGIQARRDRRRADRREDRRMRSASRPRLLLPLAMTVGLLAAGGAVSADELGLAPAPQTLPREPAGQVRQVTATDPRTRVTTRVVLTSRGTGTDVTLSLTHVAGPRTCRLVVVGVDGTSEVPATWRIPESGYGTPRRADPIEITARSRRVDADIVRLIVQSVDATGKATTLVSASP